MTDEEELLNVALKSEHTDAAVAALERIDSADALNAISQRARNKVAAFIITGGQDNVQAVAGQLLGFFGEIGCLFPQFPYIAHSRGWSHEDMENNVLIVRQSEELAEGARKLAGRLIDFAGDLIGEAPCIAIERGGRKAQAV